MTVRSRTTNAVDSPPSAVVFRIDRGDQIVSVNEAWNRFAIDNQAPELAGTGVLNRPLWQFIADPTTRQLYKTMLNRVRAGHAVYFRLRCDSPGLRRELEMTVSAKSDDTVQFESVEIATEARAPQTLWARDSPRESVFIRSCSWCNRIELNGEWREVEAAILSLRIFEQDHPPLITHGICARCVEVVEAAIEDAERVR